jgi:hypothetical protein
MNWKFWDKKPEGKARLVGMSGGVLTTPKKKTTAKKPEEQIPKVSVVGGMIAPVQPYFSIIIHDIKSFLRIDEETRKERESYNDFMEEHFPKH